MSNVWRRGRDNEATLLHNTESIHCDIAIDYAFSQHILQLLCCWVEIKVRNPEYHSFSSTCVPFYLSIPSRNAQFKVCFPEMAKYIYNQTSVKQQVKVKLMTLFTLSHQFVKDF